MREKGNSIRLENVYYVLFGRSLLPVAELSSVEAKTKLFHG